MAIYQVDHLLLDSYITKSFAIIGWTQKPDELDKVCKRCMEVKKESRQ
jgi:hypothetical protein